MKNFFKNLKLKRRIVATLAGLHFFGNPSKKLKIIGVTGTSGKTTTATLLYKIATSLGYRAGLIGTVENLIAGEKVVTRDKGPSTTPDPISLHKLLNEMMEKGCEYVFMEVSSHALDQNRVAGINFTGGIFTNLSQDHFDYHKNFNNYFSAKKKFFQMLSSKAFALSNVDDKYGKTMLEGIKPKSSFYGFNNPADFKAEIKKLDFNGLELEINGEKIISKLLGKFNAYNLLAVWSACNLLDFDKEKIKKILENIEPPKGRFDHFTSSSGVLAVVDYAHKPNALDNVISTARDIVREASKEGRVISVFGCGGDRDPLKRSIMGKIGADLSDIAIFTSDNPRTEDMNNIIDQMKTELSPDELKKVITISDRHLAISEAVRLAHKGDVILVAGFGHEHYQEINGIRNYFNDTEELEKAFLQNNEL